MKREGTQNQLYGVMAQFEDVDSLLKAARKLRDAGYTRTDAYTPYPVHGLDDELRVRKTILPAIVLGGGIVGGLTGFGMQYFAWVIHYPMNIGGKPLNSWPAFIPITFEVTVLFAALAAVVGMLALNGLPQPYHPVFNAKDFERASEDRFFLCIESVDPKFDPDEARRFLSSAGAVEVTDVPQ
ncbi:MAG: DUF3341 domain-containing protein [Thermoanaerobaculia bacterium]|nr:DUF3341 domain-containing protein [Thermoanaerobaculia bacterium]